MFRRTPSGQKIFYPLSELRNDVFAEESMKPASLVSLETLQEELMPEDSVAQRRLKER